MLTGLRLGGFLTALLTALGGFSATREPAEIMARQNAADWKNVEIAGDDARSAPQFYQFDYDRTLTVVDGEEKSVKTSGCSATCVAMVVAALTTKVDVTPETVFQWAIDQNEYAGDGVSHTTLGRMARNFGVTGTWTSAVTTTIRSALKSKKPVIAHVATGMFTSSPGHYIVLSGWTKSGLVLVNDPNSEIMSGFAFPLSVIFRQTKTAEALYITRKR